MDGRLTSMHHEVEHVEREEHNVKREEENLKKEVKKLEAAKGNSWGESDDESHFGVNQVHMIPLNQHRRHLGMMHGHNPFGFMSHISDFFKNMRHPGPAAEHSAMPIIPIHNILKPGAHPA